MIVTSPPTPTTQVGRGLTLLALGDSIPYNSPGDCSACTGYVAQYGEALAVRFVRERLVRDRFAKRSPSADLVLARTVEVSVNGDREARASLFDLHIVCDPPNDRQTTTGARVRGGHRPLLNVR